jgi:hypothetical protein
MGMPNADLADLDARPRRVGEGRGGQGGGGELEKGATAHGGSVARGRGRVKLHQQPFDTDDTDERGSDQFSSVLIRANPRHLCHPRPWLFA